MWPWIIYLIGTKEHISVFITVAEINVCVYTHTQGLWNPVNEDKFTYITCLERERDRKRERAERRDREWRERERIRESRKEGEQKGERREGE